MARNPQHVAVTWSDRVLLYVPLLRIPQLVLAAAIFAIAIINTGDFQSMSCSIPHDLKLSVICTALSLIALPYLCLFSPPFLRYRLMPSPNWIPSILDATFLIFYIVVSYYVSSPKAVCTDICTACGEMWQDMDGCTCHMGFGDEDYRSVSRIPWAMGGGAVAVPNGASMSRYIRRRRLGWIGALSIASTALFAITGLIFALRAMTAFSERRSRRRLLSRNSLSIGEEEEVPRETISLKVTSKG